MFERLDKSFQLEKSQIYGDPKIFFIVTKPLTYGWKDPRLKPNSYRTMTLVYSGYRHFVRARWNLFSWGSESLEIGNERKNATIQSYPRIGENNVSLHNMDSKHSFYNCGHGKNFVYKIIKGSQA